MIRHGFTLLLAALWLGSGLTGSAAGQAEYVVVVVWDGLRPDAVTAAATPTLDALAQGGVFFKNHHAAPLSSTIVNGTALASGCLPRHNDTCSNAEFRPALNPSGPISTAAAAVAAHLPVPTLAELVQAAGHRTAIAGSKSVALVMDATPAPPNLTISEDHGQPLALFEPIAAALGPAPAGGVDRDNWITRAMTEHAWADGRPTYSLIWLSEPDLTQHQTGLGTEKSLAALRNSDANLARILAAIETHGAEDKTDIFVVSDHAFSTVTTNIDLAAILQQAGFNAVRELPAEQTGDEIIVVSNAGAGLLYQVTPDPAGAARLVRFLQHQDFTGALFTREPHDGTFTLDQAGLNTAHPPTVLVSLRWTDQVNPHGIPGALIVDSQNRQPGQGAHGGLSGYDLHNTLIASGPDFRRGLTNLLPSGNIDLVPTILAILGIDPPPQLDGRVLFEALTMDVPLKKPPAVERQTIAASRRDDQFVWHQYLRFTKFAGALYIDEANGGGTVQPAAR